MKLLVGLGNPGKEYENTRHNIGWMVLDLLANEEKWQESKKAHAFYIKKENFEMIKPTTFMNNSGLAVAYAMKKNNVGPENIIVVHDDKDLQLGEYKIQKDRGSAGHNGVQSIIDHLGTRNFTRVRIGIAREDKRAMGDTADFVLNKFSKEEKQIAEKIISTAAEEIKKLLA